MNLTIGVVLLAIGLGMILFGRRNGTRPFMHSHVAFALYPAMTLVFIAFGVLTIVMNLSG
jgi:hypothetical protein